jgi:integrase
VMRGHIEQRSAGSWTIQASARFDDSGKRVRITRTVRGTQREAERALTKLLTEIDSGQVVRAGAETFGGYLTDRWLPHMRSRVGDATWTRYEGLVRMYLVPSCGKVKLAALRPHHLQSALDAMLADGAATASVVKCNRVASSALRQAVRWQLLPTNPAAGVSPPRAERAELRIPEGSEMRTLMDAARATPFGMPIMLAASTGLRRSEIVRLRWADVDLDTAVLRVRSGKTPHARRTVALAVSTAAALRRHRKDQAERRLLLGEAWQDEDLVVDCGDGGPVHPDSVSHAFAEIAKNVGLGDVRLHDLRHGFACVLLKAGVNVKVVSEALGHARSSFTLDVYAHVLPGMGDQVAAAIDLALGGVAAP